MYSKLYVKHTAKTIFPLDNSVFFSPICLEKSHRWVILSWQEHTKGWRSAFGAKLRSLRPEASEASKEEKQVGDEICGAAENRNCY